MTRQNFFGLVVSQGKMSKTIKVRVERRAFDRIINKEIIKRRDFLVHDEGEKAREGDLVRIQQCRPISKHKAFTIAEIKKNQGQQFAEYDQIARQQVVREENAMTRDFLARRKQTTQDIESKTSLISDLASIQRGVTAKEGSLDRKATSKIEYIKKKYGIKSWPPQEDVLRLEVQGLQKQLDGLTSSINQFDQKFTELLENKEKADAFLTEHGYNPETLKKNIRKNILRKYVMKQEDISNKISDLKI